MEDRFLKTGIFLAPFHPLAENPLLALDPTWSFWSISIG